MFADFDSKTTIPQLTVSITFVGAAKCFTVQNQSLLTYRPHISPTSRHITSLLYPRLYTTIFILCSVKQFNRGLDVWKVQAVVKS